MEGLASASAVGPGVGLRLEFLGWERPVLESAALRLFERATTGAAGAGDGAGDSGGVGATGPVDFSRILVVLPGARAGRRLKEILLRLAESQGRTIRPPEMATVGSLPERLYRPGRPRPDPVLDRQAWARALELVGEREIAKLVAAPAAAAEVGLARLIRDLHREVGGAGLDFSAVAEACRSGLLFNDEVRWRVLDGISSRYRALLRDLGFEDLTEARAAALRGGAVGAEKDLWLVGCPDLPPVTRSFVSALAERATVSILVGAPETLSVRFDPLGCVIPEAWEAAHVELLDADIEVVSSPAEQADAVLRHLFELGGRFPAEEITVGVPDPEVVPYIVERLEERGVRVRDARGRAMRATSAYRLLEALARYIERPETEELACLARHPTFEARVWSAARDASAEGGAPPGPRADLPASLDRYQKPHLQAALDSRSLPSGGEWASAPVTPPVRAALNGVASLLSPLGLSASREGARPSPTANSRSLAVWAPRLAELLDGLFAATEGTGARGERELEEVLARLAESLARFLTLPPAVDPPVPAHRAIRALLEDIQDEPLPEEWEGPAVELLGWLELALDDASEMIVAGFNDPFVPSSVTSHPFLPHSLREKIGLLGNRGRWARDLLALETMLRTRRRLRLVTGRRSGAGDPLMPSRLLFAADAPVVAARLERIVGLDAFDAVAPPEPAGSVGGPETDGLVLPPEPVIYGPAPPDRIQVSAFRDLLTDPYKYALSRLLGLEPVDDEAREMDPRLFGTLAHEVLHRFGRSPASTSADLKEITVALEALLEEEARNRFGARPLPAVRPQVGQLRARLAAFAKWQANWVGRGWRIRAVEVSPVSGGAPFDVDGTPILLRGKIDRIDENVETGDWCVLDYKTADKAKKPEDVHRAGSAKKRRWIDLQLPLYRVLAASIEASGGGALVPEGALAPLQLGYVLLPGAPDAVGVAWASWSAEELAGAEEEARRMVRLLRENRFEYDSAQSTIRSDDPLATVVGEGVLRLPSAAARIVAGGFAS